MGCDGHVLGQEVIAGEPFADLHDVADDAHVGHVLSKQNLHTKSPKDGAAARAAPSPVVPVN